MTSNHPPRVTLKDVAQLSGVSVPTASRVLNGQGRVSPGTRARILEAAERLNFQPNALAQQFASGRSNTIALLALNAPGWFTMPVLTGSMRMLGKQNLAAQLYDARHSDRSLLRSLRVLAARRVDGVVVIGDGTQVVMPSITAELSVPVVYVFGTTTNPDDIVLLPDGRMAGRMAIDHLVAGGRRKIAHITDSSDLTADLRLQGVNEALAAYQLTMAGGGPRRSDWTQQWGSTATRALLDEGVDFDAIFCGNDEIAIGAYAVLHDAGRHVPHDVALLGVDNMNRRFGAGAESLSTIDPQLTGLGESASELLLQRLSGVTVATGMHFHPCALVAGGSTAQSA